jgi:sulfatase maturation enzyme AslB (radical SAM superfamily)
MKYRKKKMASDAFMTGFVEGPPSWFAGNSFAEVTIQERSNGNVRIVDMNGDVYFCKTDIFEATFEPADE